MRLSRRAALHGSGRGVSVSITGAGNTAEYFASYVIINGVTYSSAAELILPMGTVISCYVGAAPTMRPGTGLVTVDGTVVVRSTTAGLQDTYEHTVATTCTINLSYTNRGGFIAITTT